MQHLKMNGELYKELVINGAANLALHYKEVDALNVFPVPDGDTGTNMRMTIEAGANELKKFEEKSIYEVAKKLSRGMLMGARGNSGVILSQFFRGIYKGLAGFEEVQAKDLAKAFLSGVDQAYHAVMKPVEGTILTVARESAKKAYKTVKKGTTIEAFFKILIDEAHSSLGRTPSLLPALQEAGVVDSGGAGLVYVFEGMLKALQGETVKPVDHVQAQSVVTSGSFNADSELEYGYCTEFILQLQNKKVDPEKFSIIPLGADVISTKCKCYEELRLLYVGTLEGRRIADTIEGIAIFKQKHQDVKLYYDIVGDGITDTKEHLEDLVIKYDLCDVIRIHGRVSYDKLYPFFEECNIGVSYVPITPWYDHQPPTKTFEYIMSGLFCLATNTSENQKLITHVNGILHKDNPIDFSNALEQYVQYKSKLDYAKIKNSLSEYNWKSIVNNKLLPVIKSVNTL